jgi:DNA-binding transcriptional MerR regulator
MVHQIAKLILEHAQTPADRVGAIQKAWELGMPLHKIEEYLDWLDSIQKSRQVRANRSKSQLRQRDSSQP